MLETLCEILVDAYDRNWITSRDGNMSVRDHSHDYFYITPSSTRKQTLQPDQFKKIRVTDAGPVELPYTDISKNLRPSGEMPLHFGLQRAMGKQSDDIRVVVHLHPTYCVAAMHAGIELGELVKSFPELSRYTNVGPNVGDVPPISQQLADECFKSFNLDDKGFIDYDIIGIKGHGVVAVDSSPWRAYEHVERLEHICRIVLASGNY